MWMGNFSAMAPLLYPWAIMVKTSCCRGLKPSVRESLRGFMLFTTVGSMTTSPEVAPSMARARSPASLTDCLSRYDQPKDSSQEISPRYWCSRWRKKV